MLCSTNLHWLNWLFASYINDLRFCIINVGLKYLLTLQKVSTIACLNCIAITSHAVLISRHVTVQMQYVFVIFMWPYFVIPFYCSSFAAICVTNPPYIAMSRLLTFKLPPTVSFLQRLLVSIQFQCIPICWFLGMFDWNEFCLFRINHTTLCALTCALP